MTGGPNSARRYDVVIVGAGISGLTAAWRLRDRNVLVLEAADQVGGRLKTEVRGPYWLNLGAHVLMAGGPMEMLARELGVPLVHPSGHFLAVAMRGKIVTAGRVEEMLFRLPLSLIARISLVRIGLKMLWAKRTPPERLEALTFAEFLGPTHPDVEALMRVIANRLTGELNELSAYVGVNGFNHLWLGSRLNIAGGSAELPRALQTALGERIRTGAAVIRVEQTAANVEVVYEQLGVRHYVSAEAAILAVPAPLARNIVSDLPAELDDALARMRYTPFVVAGLFTNETAPMPWDSLYALAVPDKSFCMLFNPANALRQGPRRSGGGLVVYSVAERASQLIGLDDREIVDRYLRDLFEIYPRARTILESIVIQRWPHGTALGYPGRSTYLARLAKGFGRIAFAGDYMIPLDGTDASESGDQAARLILGGFTDASVQMLNS